MPANCGALRKKALCAVDNNGARMNLFLESRLQFFIYYSARWKRVIGDERGRSKTGICTSGSRRLCAGREKHFTLLRGSKFDEERHQAGVLCFIASANKLNRPFNYLQCSTSNISALAKNLKLLSSIQSLALIASLINAAHF